MKIYDNYRTQLFPDLKEFVTPKSSSSSSSSSKSMSQLNWVGDMNPLPSIVRYKQSPLLSYTSLSDSSIPSDFFFCSLHFFFSFFFSYWSFRLWVSLTPQKQWSSKMKGSWKQKGISKVIWLCQVIYFNCI